MRIVVMALGGYSLAIASLVMAAWSAESDLYLLAGRMLFPAYVAAAVGLWVLHRGLGPMPGPLVRGGLWLTLAALTVGLVGDLGSYYGGSGNGSTVAFSYLQSIFYSAVEFPAVAAALFGIALYGLGLVRSGTVPGPAGWLVAAVGPIGVLLWLFHPSSGALFALNLLVVTGALYRFPERSGEDFQPQPIS